MVPSGVRRCRWNDRQADQRTRNGPAEMQALVWDRRAGTRRRSRDGVSTQRPGAAGRPRAETNLDTDLGPSPGQLQTGPGPSRETPNRRSPARCTGATDALGVDVAPDRTPDAQPVREATDEPGSVTTESFCCSDASVTRTRRRATGREKTLAKDTSDKYTKNSYSSTTIRTARST